LLAHTSEQDKEQHGGNNEQTFFALPFSRAKNMNEIHFIIKKDYKCFLTQSGEQKSEGRGGHNK